MHPRIIQEELFIEPKLMQKKRNIRDPIARHIGNQNGGHLFRKVSFRMIVNVIMLRFLDKMHLKSFGTITLPQTGYTKGKKSRSFCMDSLWRKQTGKIKQGREESGTTGESKENIRWDVIVVGAGLAGVLTAYYLKEQGMKVLVLEAKEIASGQTERTTAKITSQHGLKYRKLIQDIGEEKARLYALANEASIREYERLIRTLKIDCNFEKTAAYLYSEQDEDVLQEEAKAAVDRKSTRLNSSHA